MGTTWGGYQLFYLKFPASPRGAVLSNKHKYRASQVGSAHYAASPWQKGSAQRPRAGRKRESPMMSQENGRQLGGTRFSATAPPAPALGGQLHAFRRKLRTRGLNWVIGVSTAHQRRISIRRKFSARAHRAKRLTRASGADYIESKSKFHASGNASAGAWGPSKYSSTLTAACHSVASL